MIFVQPNWMLIATDTYNRLESMIKGKFQGMQDLYLTEIGQIWTKIDENVPKSLKLATMLLLKRPKWLWVDLVGLNLHTPKFPPIFEAFWVS